MNEFIIRLFDNLLINTKNAAGVAKLFRNAQSVHD